MTAWNSGAQALYGYTAEEIVGQPSTALFRRTGWTKSARSPLASETARAQRISRRCAAVRTEHASRFR
ncbi:MAG: hypothetical protein JO020_12830 [Chloroflexi bacterium]|nr:hypothetical protein [Chloroflexota bacterium]